METMITRVDTNLEAGDEAMETMITRVDTNLEAGRPRGRKMKQWRL